MFKALHLHLVGYHNLKVVGTACTIMCGTSFLPLQLFEPEKPPLKITQLHYTSWPDHGVPENVMSIINFIRCVRKQHPASLNQPLLVHCSAGVGRTGTFILLDVMMQQMKEEGTISINQFLCTMRSQRMKMVQTLVSYCILQAQGGPYFQHLYVVRV